MIPQHIAHAFCTSVQPEAEHGMGHKTPQPCPDWIECFGSSNAETQCPLHDQKRNEHRTHAKKKSRIICNAPGCPVPPRSANDRSA